MPWSLKRKTTPRKSREEKRKEKTEQAAHQIFQNRLLLGKPGDHQSDWQTAEKIVRSPIKSALFASHCQFIKLEKQYWEPILTWTNNQAWLGLISVIGNIGIIVGVVIYVGSEKQRRDAEVLNAWQTITSAHGQSGNGGRIQALEFLNASPGANWRRKFPWFCAPLPLCTWTRESLAGINLGVETVDDPPSDRNSSSDDKQSDDRKPGVYLRAIQLPRADLQDANLEGANLRSTNLEGADLWSANLEGTDLWSANLEGADLWRANLERADLVSTNLEGAVLQSANLEGADLRSANLEGADLRSANLERAVLQSANLERADLRSANLEGAAYFGEQTSPQACESFSAFHPCPTRFPEGFDPKAAGMRLVK